jgi:hypothetical protein
MSNVIHMDSTNHDRPDLSSGMTRGKNKDLDIPIPL